MRNFIEALSKQPDPAIRLLAIKRFESVDKLHSAIVAGAEKERTWLAWLARRSEPPSKSDLQLLDATLEAIIYHLTPPADEDEALRQQEEPAGEKA